MNTFNCSRCGLFQCLNLRALLNHIYPVHSQDLNFRIVCCVDGCSISFMKYNSLYKHIIRNHRTLYNTYNDRRNITNTNNNSHIDNENSDQNEFLQSEDIKNQTEEELCDADDNNNACGGSDVLDQAIETDYEEMDEEDIEGFEQLQVSLTSSFVSVCLNSFNLHASSMKHIQKKYIEE